jgi:hypothetical protein
MNAAPLELRATNVSCCATPSIFERRPRLDSVPIERYARNGAHPRAFLCRNGVTFGKRGAIQCRVLIISGAKPTFASASRS